VLIEGAILIKQLVDLWNAPDWPYPPVAAGSVLGKGQRYIVFAWWPDWDPKKRLPPATKVLRDGLEAIGCDFACAVEEKNGVAGFIEVHAVDRNVRDVQGVFAEHGGVAVVCFPAGAAEWVPEISYDAWEAYQEAVDDIEDTNWAWWTETFAKWTLAIVLVVGLLWGAWFVIRRRKS
jgi:hypothetical protein